MILAIKAEHTTIFQSLVEEMVRRENERGDSLDAQKLMLALLAGQRSLLAFYENEDTPTPLMLLVYHVAVDIERSRSTLWIDNIFVPSGTALREKVDPEDRSALAERFSFFHRTMFVSDNPTLLSLLSDLGVTVSQKAVIYQLTIPAEEANNG